jgi:plasmid maintenance system antidote protein VapI
MAKRSRVWNRSVYDRYLREGRGCGSGSDYAPWIRVQNFGSQGIVSRVKGQTTGRVHHLMSKNELAYFYLLDWSDDVLDIREQYPLLDLATTVKTASQAGIKYPTDNVSSFPYVLTCDFMITTTNGLKARTIKLSSELNNKRVIEKLEIERRYWQIYEIDWKIVTENEISYTKARNIEWLYSARDFNLANEADEVRSAELTMLEILDVSEYSVIEIVNEVEKKFSLTKGMGLILFKSLALTKKINLGLDKPLDLKNIKKVSVIK